MQSVGRFVCIVRDPDTMKLCAADPVPGDNRCALHKGSGYGVAARRITRSANMVREDAVALGPPREVDPGVALLEEIHRTAGNVAWLANKVAELEDSEMVWSKVMTAHESVSGGPGGGYTMRRKENRQTINAWYEIYMRERDHLMRATTKALQVGIEERKVHLAERGVDALESALSSALLELGLDPQSAHVRATIGAHLRLALEADIFGIDKPESQPLVVDMQPVFNAPTERPTGAPPAGGPQPVDF